MVKKLDFAENCGQKSSSKAKKLVNRIKSDFEKSMNDDLQVKTAFDFLYKTVSRLVKLSRNRMLSAEDSMEVLEKLKSIDYVLQVIF
jgi:hypothetical protein